MKFANILKTLQSASKRKIPHILHLVSLSLKPLVVGLALGITVLIQVCNLHDIYVFGTYNEAITILSLISFWAFVVFWFFSVVVEAGDGSHTAQVQDGLSQGIIFFIVSEILFFFAFFWTYSHFGTGPNDAGSTWPTIGIERTRAKDLPLVNTALLVFSGISITYAHSNLMKCKTQVLTKGKEEVKFALGLLGTIVLGILFLGCQWSEYKWALRQTWHGESAGSIFFIATGFHGLHVTLGLLCLTFILARWLFIFNNKNYAIRAIILILNDIFVFLKLSQRDFVIAEFHTKEQHTGFLAAVWYWHFVDIVWVLLYIIIYWWGGAV